MPDQRNQGHRERGQFRHAGRIGILLLIIQHFQIFFMDIHLCAGLPGKGCGGNDMVKMSVRKKNSAQPASGAADGVQKRFEIIAGIDQDAVIPILPVYKIGGSIYS